MDNPHFVTLNDDVENEDEEHFNDIICYDSGEDSTHESKQKVEMKKLRFVKVRDRKESAKLKPPNERIKKKSNAEQMRKYRAKQRSDPERYKKYLAKERLRNFKRKYEKRLKIAEEKAQELGLPYIVIEQYPDTCRGRRRKSPSNDVTIVLPSKFKYPELDISHSIFSDSQDDMPIIPQVDLTESDEIYQKPNDNCTRSVLQMLLPQEVIERERMSNFVKMDHDYYQQTLETTDAFSNHSKVERRKKKDKIDRKALLEHREQYNSKKRRSKIGKYSESYRFDSVFNSTVVHEDIDDLFKELAEVANKPVTKTKASEQKTAHSDGEFSLTVCMPVKHKICNDDAIVLKMQCIGDENFEDNFITNFKEEPIFEINEEIDPVAESKEEPISEIMLEPICEIKEE